MSYYTHYKDLFNSIKPIRGRAQDVRPIGQRRRDWETINMDGDVVECVLYGTPVVRYYPDGRIGLRSNGWITPSTADYMHTHSPFTARKKQNELWVTMRGEDPKSYPLRREGETTFVLTGDNKWEPETPIVLNKQVVDKDKAKEARAPFMPFLKFVDSFLKLSDGWIMDATMAEVGTLDMNSGMYSFGGYNPLWATRRTSSFWSEKVLGYMLDFIGNAESDEQYLKAMCMLASVCEPIERRLARSVLPDDRNWAYKLYDKQYDPKHLRNKMYRIIAKGTDIHNTIEVEYK